MRSISSRYVMAESSREADDAAKLSLKIEAMEDLLREADYWARAERKQAIYLGDVERALREQAGQPAEKPLLGRQQART